MRWFRSNIRFGARLALFALAVQIVLSFGHVHLSDLVRVPATVTAQADTGGTPARGDQQNGTLDPGCAICALIQLASTSPPSAAPALPLPIILSHVRLDPGGNVALAAAPHAHFQARAPPVA
jgi:hypothetical protein